MSAIDDVKQRLDIVQIVSEYVKLQKAGRNYKSSCPFHSEKDPSFFVFPERQSWHCFGACGFGGDIFSFLTKKTIKNFQLGFAAEGWDTLKQFLKGKGYDEVELLAAGLLVERDDKNNYDRFRNRLMFPIRNIAGKVTGFGGRALDDSLPKYLNSPQTPVFDKSGSLYGIDRAKTYI